MKKFINPNWKELRKLSSSLVQAWFYVWDQADAVGVYTYDGDYMGVDLGAKITFDQLLTLPGVEKIDGERILMTDYIAVNYGRLKEDYNPHKPAFRSIEKHNLTLNSSLTQACFKLEDEDEDEDEESKKESRARKTEKNPYPTHRDCMEVYSKFYESQAGVVPKIDAADGKAMKTMIAYFRSAVKKKQPDLSEREAEAAIVDSFRYIFGNFDKWQPFHKGRLKLTQISSDLPNIIQSIKTYGTSNNSEQNRNGKGGHHVTPEEAAAALHRLHQEQSARHGSDAAG